MRQLLALTPTVTTDRHGRQACGHDDERRAVRDSARHTGAQSCLALTLGAHSSLSLGGARQVTATGGGKVPAPLGCLLLSSSGVQHCAHCRGEAGVTPGQSPSGLGTASILLGPVLEADPELSNH